MIRVLATMIVGFFGFLFSFVCPIPFVMPLFTIFLIVKIWK
jgi:hypothetical protein